MPHIPRVQPSPLSTCISDVRASPGYHVITVSDALSSSLTHEDAPVCVIASIQEFCDVTRTMSVMALTLNRPPTMRTLLEDPAFRKMMRTRPRLPSNLIRPGMSEPWHVWILMESEKWKRGRFHTYDEAYVKMRNMLERDDVQDVAITSIRFMLPPPIGFKWQSRKYPWCARCRRPSVFLYRLLHRAIDFEEVNTDEPIRCFYCGHRQVSLPRWNPR